MDFHTEPRPKYAALVNPKNCWEITSVTEAQPLEPSWKLSFGEVIGSRRTERDCEAMPLGNVLALLQFAMRAEQTGCGDNRGRIRKHMISAGALQPIEVLVVAGPDVVEPIIYLDRYNVFGTVTLQSVEGATAAIQALANIVPQANGHYLLLVANLRHVNQVYENALSLLWRDAGAVLQTLSMVAAASDVAFVPLGSTGHAILEAIDAPHDGYVAVGTAVIGTRRAHTGAGLV